MPTMGQDSDGEKCGNDCPALTGSREFAVVDALTDQPVDYDRMSSGIFLLDYNTNSFYL